jgi:hypothetical protein
MSKPFWGKAEISSVTLNLASQKEKNILIIEAL